MPHLLADGWTYWNIACPGTVSMGNWLARHDLSCWLGHKTSTQTNKQTLYTMNLLVSLGGFLNVSNFVRLHFSFLSHLMKKPAKWLCAQRRLRSAWASPQSDQSSLCTLWVAKDPSFLHADSKDSDQTGRMPRLIWVFAGCTYHFVGFVMRRLIFQKKEFKSQSIKFAVRSWKRDAKHWRNSRLWYMIVALLGQLSQ